MRRWIGMAVCVVASKLCKAVACERASRLLEARLNLQHGLSSVPVNRPPEHGKPPERVRLLVVIPFTADVIAAKACT